jgi:hypothetical protein
VPFNNNKKDLEERKRERKRRREGEREGGPS